MTSCICAFALAVIFPFGSAAAQDTPPDIGPENQEQPVLEDLPTPMVPEERPVSIIDASLSGWNEADSGDSTRETGIRSHWVMPDSGGSIPGTVWGVTADEVDDMKIFLLRNGTIVNQTTTTESGHFRLEGLSEGLYTIVGYSPSAIFAFGFNVVNYRESCLNMPRHISTQAISLIDNKIVASELISEHSSEVRFPLIGRYAFGEEDLNGASHFGWQGLGQFDVPAIPATTIESHPIALGVGGTFRGRLHQINNQNGRPIPIMSSKVILIQSGSVVGNAHCNRQGIFEFASIAPGDYGLVAVGSDGFAATGIRLVSPDAPSSQSGIHNPELPESVTVPPGTQTAMPVSQVTAQPSTPQLDMTLIQDEAIGWLNHFVTEQQFLEDIARPRNVADVNFGLGFGEPGFCQDCHRACAYPLPSCSCDR